MFSWPSVSSRSFSSCCTLSFHCDPGSWPRSFGAPEPHGKNAQHVARTMHNMYMMWGSQSAQKRNKSSSLLPGAACHLSDELPGKCHSRLPKRKNGDASKIVSRYYYWPTVSSFLSDWTWADLGCSLRGNSRLLRLLQRWQEAGQQTEEEELITLKTLFRDYMRPNKLQTWAKYPLEVSI